MPQPLQMPRPLKARYARVCYFGCLKGGLKVSSGTAEWYRSSYGTDFDNAETASPVLTARYAVA